MNNTKIKNVEFLRIIGCIAIVMFHLCSCVHSLHTVADIKFYNHLNNNTLNGMIAVDLFFILSGFFFMYKSDFQKSIWEFLKKKLIRLYPLFIFLLGISFLISTIFQIYEFNFYQAILTLFGFNGTSLSLNLGLYPEIHLFWYVSAMLWVLMFYYYLYQNFSEKCVNLTIIILTYISYSILVHFIWANWEPFYGIINSGMLRAIGGIGVGVLIANWYKKYKIPIREFSINRFGQLLITIIEFMCLYFIINDLILHSIKFDNKFLFVVVFALTLILFLSNKGWISRMLNRNIFVNLAQYTYSIYLSHGLVILILWSTLWKTHNHLVHQYPVLNFVLTLVLILITGVILHYSVENPATKYLKEKIK